MNTIRKVILLAGIILPLHIAHAQTVAETQAQLQALEQAEPTPAADVPMSGRFYPASLANRGIFAPILPPGTRLPAWNLGDGAWLVDDLEPVIPLRNGRRMLSSDGGPLPPGAGSAGGGDYTNTYSYTPLEFGTNLCVIQAAASNGWLTALGSNTVADATYSYGIESRTNLLQTDWRLEAVIPATTSNTVPFRVAHAGRDNLLVQLAGMPADAWGVPLWWYWEYFGDLFLTGTNLDSQDNTLADDYANNLDPNVIFFTVSATNYYVNQTTVPVQVNLTSGTPSYYAVLVNDTNPVDAEWQAYVGTNLNVMLGYTDGVYQVWVGLKGLPANATQTWETGNIPFTLDRMPAAIVITNLAAFSGSRPFIDPAGYTTKSLSSLTFFITNADGGISQHQGIVVDQDCNPSDMNHVTNRFECLDVALTEGTNHIGIHAADWAGNVTTTNFNYVFNTNGDTTPPAIVLFWPQDKMAISGTSFTLRGTLDDDTATVSGQYMDTNGATNLVNGLVERGGRFWLENLPLNPGTNLVTIMATDAAGNTSTTNLTLMQGGVTLTVNPVDDAQLNQASMSVSGSISDPAAAVWVNGVPGTNDGSGYWSADNVPMTSGGTASFDVTAYPSGDMPSGEAWTNFATAQAAYANPATTGSTQASFSEDKPPVVYVQQLDWSYDNYMEWVAGRPEIATATENWAQGSGGSQHDTTSYTQSGTEAFILSVAAINWPADAGLVPVLPEHYDVNTYTNGGLHQNYDGFGDPYPGSDYLYMPVAGGFEHIAGSGRYPANANGWVVPPTWSETAQYVVKLFTGGKATRQSQSLFILSQSLDWSTGDAYDYGQYDESGGVPSPEIALDALGNLDSDGTLATVQADGKSVVITPRANRSYYFGYLPGKSKYSLIHQVICLAPGDTNFDRTTLGIREFDVLSGMPSGTAWSLSGGGHITQTNGSGTEYIAPGSPTSATITATYRLKSISVTFDVIAPSSIVAVSYIDPPLGDQNNSGTEMGEFTEYTDFFGPTNVSFSNVNFREFQSASTNILWPNGTNSIVNFKMSTNAFQIDCDDIFKDDVVFPLVSTSYLLNESSYADITFTNKWFDQYQDDNGNWVSFAALSATWNFRGSDKKCRVTYLGMPGDWQGPFDNPN